MLTSRIIALQAFFTVDTERFDQARSVNGTSGVLVFAE